MQTGVKLLSLICLFQIRLEGEMPFEKKPRKDKNAGNPVSWSIRTLLHPTFVSILKVLIIIIMAFKKGQQFNLKGCFVGFFSDSIFVFRVIVVIHFFSNVVLLHHCPG